MKNLLYKKNMIIKCKKCNKSFEIDSNLIPENGRLLQCGSCEYEWFFIKEKDKSKIDDLPKIIKDTSSKILKKEENEEVITEDIFEAKIDKINDDEYIELKKEKNKKDKDKNISFINMIFVFIISFTALIILLDTFKNQLSTIIPNIDLILNNLYETLKDIYLFFKDLIK